MESVVKSKVASVFKKLKNPWIQRTVCPISRDAKVVCSIGLDLKFEYPIVLTGIIYYGLDFILNTVL